MYTMWKNIAYLNQIRPLYSEIILKSSILHITHINRKQMFYMIGIMSHILVFISFFVLFYSLNLVVLSLVSYRPFHYFSEI